MTDARLDAMARHMWDARRARARHANLPEALKPSSIAEAYLAQETLALRVSYDAPEDAPEATIDGRPLRISVRLA